MGEDAGRLGQHLGPTPRPLMIDLWVLASSNDCISSSSSSTSEPLMEKEINFFDTFAVDATYRSALRWSPPEFPSQKIENREK